MRLHAVGEYLAQMRHLDDDAFAIIADRSWYKAIGLRTIISHDYEGVDRDILWQILTAAMPTLSASIDDALQNIGDDWTATDPTDTDQTDE